MEDKDIALRRAKMKLAAAERAKLALIQAWDRVDYRIDVIEPKIKELERVYIETGALPKLEIEQ